jgi:hypothetical protein
VKVAATALPIDLFPNPSSAQSSATLSYFLPRRASVQVSVLDAVGRVVGEIEAHSQQAGPQVVQLPAMPAGLYTVRVVHEGTVTYRKWVVGE